MRVYSNPYANTCMAKNKQNKNVSFGMNDKAFIEDVLNKTVKGSKKLPSVVSNISFEVDQPTAGKKQAVLNAIKKADDWYKETLEDLARDWGLKVD